MAYRDLLLQLTTYPKPTPDRFIEAAAALALMAVATADIAILGITFLRFD